MEAQTTDQLTDTAVVEPQGAQTTEAPITMSPEEEAAMKFTKLLPYVSKLGDALNSKGGAVRVLTALAEFPLGSTKPRLLNDGERQLFQIMMELQQYKSTVITSIMQRESELKRLQAQAGETAAVNAPTAESEGWNG